MPSSLQILHKDYYVTRKFIKNYTQLPRLTVEVLDAASSNLDRDACDEQ